MKKLLLSFLFIFTFAVSNAQILGYSVGDVVDDFTITTIDGEEINLYDITATGQYVYIDFFFVDCGPCQATAPHFNELHETYGCNQGDIFCVSVNTGQDDDAYVETYEDNYGGDFEPCPISSGDGGSGVVNTDFSPAAYPTICLIGPENTLLNADIWPIDSYMTFVDALIDEGFTPEAMECSVVGIDELNSKPKISIYPNPADQFITISIEGNEALEYVEFYNYSGQKIGMQDLGEVSNSNSFRIELDNFESGLYLAKFYNKSNEVQTLKFSVLK